MLEQRHVPDLASDITVLRVLFQQNKFDDRQDSFRRRRRRRTSSRRAARPSLIFVHTMRLGPNIRRVSSSINGTAVDQERNVCLRCSIEPLSTSGFSSVLARSRDSISHRATNLRLEANSALEDQ